MAEAEKRKLPKGYMGKILEVDLSHLQSHTEPLDLRLAELFFGGRGFGVALLFKHFSNLQKQGKYKNAFADIEPLSEDNVIIISTSPGTATRMPTSGRVHMNFKSPLTSYYGSTNTGGRWAVDFKRAGFDIIIITGKAEKPVYLLITNERSKFVDGSEIFELNAVQKRERLKELYGPKTAVLAIGQAGKNLVPFASVMSDVGKAFGRTGAGAVWGSKNLQAIAVVADERKIEVAEPEGFDSKNPDSAMYHAKLKIDLGKFTKRENAFGILSSMGSLGIMGMINSYKQLIRNNMKDTNHNIDDVRKIDGEALRNHSKNAKPGEKKVVVKKGVCFNCPIACKRDTAVLDENGQLIEKGEGPEFENTVMLGANLSIYDLPTIVLANYLCNRYGLDTISTGSTIACFFELYEYVSSKKQSLTAQEKQFLDDVKDFVQEHGDVGFGKPELLIPIIHLIGKLEGIGKYLAMGSYKFCERYGHKEFSMTIKKLELPAYDPRTTFSQALSYEMSNRGGCHLEGGYTAPYAYCAGYAEWPGNRVEGTALIAKNATLTNTTYDIIGVCAYNGFSLSLDEFAELVNAVTGLEHNSGTLEKIAQRTLTLERLFNILCGVTDKDDLLPERFYTEAIEAKDGPAKCDKEAFESMHKTYYNSLGWDDNGKPTEDTIEKLQLTDFIPAGLK